ncbi:hypothetical protein [Streptomyces stelliscabiei]|uniref:NADPH-dependent F420 reductase n=1 Tax=Streptomyces stelliscabiei TaxID=146820 RepID=UPI002FF4392C
MPRLPADPLAGKIVIDANNYYRPRDGVTADLLAGGLTAGELFQRYVPGARTVKTFNTIYFEHLIALARPAGSPDRSALPITGDDAAAKKSVTTLLDRLGYDTADAGTMSESWRIQDGNPDWVLPYLSDPRLPWPQDPGKPADSYSPGTGRQKFLRRTDQASRAETSSWIRKSRSRWVPGNDSETVTCVDDHSCFHSSYGLLVVLCVAVGMVSKLTLLQAAGPHRLRGHHQPRPRARPPHGVGDFNPRPVR